MVMEEQGKYRSSANVASPQSRTRQFLDSSANRGHDAGNVSVLVARKSNRFNGRRQVFEADPGLNGAPTAESPW